MYLILEAINYYYYYIKVSKEEAEKTCKSVNKKAKLAALTKEEVTFVKEVMKTGKNQGLS